VDSCIEVKGFGRRVDSTDEGTGAEGLAAVGIRSIVPGSEDYWTIASILSLLRWIGLGSVHWVALRPRCIPE
jgi:hypothetical protein